MKLHKLTTEQRQEKFTKELQSLLKKYDVELTLEEDDNIPYVTQMTLMPNFNSQLVEGDILVEFSEKNLGTWIDGDKENI